MSCVTDIRLRDSRKNEFFIATIFKHVDWKILVSWYQSLDNLTFVIFIQLCVWYQNNLFINTNKSSLYQDMLNCYLIRNLCYNFLAMSEYACIVFSWYVWPNKIFHIFLLLLPWYNMIYFAGILQPLPYNQIIIY